VKRGDCIGGEGRGFLGLEEGRGNPFKNWWPLRFKGIAQKAR